ncbi:hypothetical protein Tco_0247123 [Tanacetum coccineum]
MKAHFGWACLEKKLGVTVEGEVMFEPERPRMYVNLDYHEKERYKADFRATLFLLEGLPKDIYMLVNHITEAKVIWNDIKMLMGDTRLTKDVCTRPEVQDPDNDIDHVGKKHEVHEIHYEVQQTNVLDSDSADMGNSNIIPYEQYVKHYEGLVIPSGESSVPNDAYVMHENSAYVPDDSLVTELSIYKQQVAMYEQRAKFDLTLREQKMDEQMRMLIQDRNKKEENLKNELHSVKLQLNSTIKSNTIIEETVTALKHEFKQKETKFLTDFSNMKTLNDKLENKLYAQDQSIQIVYMMLKPKKLHDHDDVTVVGAQNPFYLRKAKVAQPTLYDGDEILKTHHVPVSVTSSEEDLEIVEITGQKMNEKLNDPVCVEKRIKIIPPNYYKENFLATFTPQTQLTPEQVFWSNDLLKQRAKALKANSPPLPI